MKITEYMDEIEKSDKIKKMIIVDNTNEWIKEIANDYPLILISNNGFMPFLTKNKKNKKKTKIFYKLENNNNINLLINSENLLYYRISTYLLNYILISRFNYDVLIYISTCKTIIHKFSLKISNEEIGLSKYGFSKLLFAKKQKFKFDDKCPICYELLTEQNVIKTNCSHVFCKSCLSQLKNTICPMCRTEIKKLVSININIDFIEQIKEKINLLNEKTVYSTDLRIKKFFKNVKIERINQNIERSKFIVIDLVNKMNYKFIHSLCSKIDSEIFLFSI